MRVIAGEYKGRRIMPVKSANIRYTSDRVKTALFSILGADVEGSDFLDLYAGSGNVGIEAISRGARSVTFVDVNPSCIRTISANLYACGIEPMPPRVKLMRMEAIRALGFFRRRNIRFDIIFLDPPYGLGLVQKSLQEIPTCGILSDNGEVVAEHDLREDVQTQTCLLVMTRQERYGTTVLSFYRVGA